MGAHFAKGVVIVAKFKRKTKQKADAILCADTHIRADSPVSRTDDFFASLSGKLDKILELSDENKCPILVAGDLGHKAQWPNWLLEWFISKVKGYEIICICGQHDLPNHRLDLFEKSGMGVLQAAGVISLLGFNNFPLSLEFDNFWLHGFPYGVGIQNIKGLDNSKPRIAMTHEMIIEKVDLFPDQNAIKGNQILKKFSQFSIVHSGDNHNPFTCEYQGRRLVNPGSLMRSSADQINHKPRVYLWFAESNDIEAVYLPIEQGVISRTHIEVAEDRRNRNEAFITRCNNMEDLEIKYEVNLENYLAKYKTQIPVKNKIWEAVG